MSTKESYISTGIALLPVPHNTLLLLVILRVRAHGKFEVLGRHCNVRPITGVRGRENSYCQRRSNIRLTNSVFAFFYGFINNGRVIQLVFDSYGR